MQPGQHLGHAFEIAAQPPEARQPCKAALDDPALWQQHKAFLGLRQLDHLQLDAVLRRIAFGLLACITLVCPSQIVTVSGRFLHLLAQCIDLGALLLAGGHDSQRYQMTQRIDSRMHLRAVALFVAITQHAAHFRSCFAVFGRPG